jgi:dihydroxyacid dehydratase/phosphogluconate dehydratase
VAASEPAPPEALRAALAALRAADEVCIDAEEQDVDLAIDDLEARLPE